MGNGFAFYYTFLKYLIMHYFYIKIFTTLAGTHFRRSEQILLFSALADAVCSDQIQTQSQLQKHLLSVRSE